MGSTQSTPSTYYYVWNEAIEGFQIYPAEGFQTSPAPYPAPSVIECQSLTALLETQPKNELRVKSNRCKEKCTIGISEFIKCMHTEKSE